MVVININNVTNFNFSLMLFFNQNIQYYNFHPLFYLNPIFY